MPSLLFVPVIATVMVFALVMWLVRSKRAPSVLPWGDVLSARKRPATLALLPPSLAEAAGAGAPQGAATAASHDASSLTVNTPQGYRVAVVGGGLAGATAARLLARHGATVTLFEKGAVVGGRAASFACANGKWPLRLEQGMDCVPSGSHALAEVCDLVRVPPYAVSPVDDYTYVVPGTLVARWNCGLAGHFSASDGH
jgi:NADPH-dependent 2,4-dienoyl-CoA reductase/sulfur reductase-like enzyme